jgi:hypothetical protein
MSLWRQLHEVIRDEDDLVGRQLVEISRITRGHLECGAGATRLALKEKIDGCNR